MTEDTPAFYTLDRGTMAISASLVAPVDGRYRLLAAATAPVETDSEALLEDLAWRVARTDVAIAGPMQGWQEWSRLEVRTASPSKACLVAASEETGRRLEHAFVGAGWHISARFYGTDPDLIALGEACLDVGVDAVVVGSSDDANEEERESLRLLWPRCGSIARFRDDLAVVACGPFSDRPEGIPDVRLFSLPAPERVPATTQTSLRQAARQVGSHLQDHGEDAFADGHEALRTSIASLAGLLDSRVEGIGVGSASGSRTLAHSDRELRHAVLATGALLPASILEDGAEIEAILRWSALSADADTLSDRLRELTLRPWAGHDQQGVRLRLAALRAALVRMQEAWAPAGGASDAATVDDDAADVVVLTGGVFSALPPPASALALVDSVRRPGALTILHDHARVLGPLGALPIEGDRRRLIADLMDDCLLPIGSALLTGSLGDDRESCGVIGISSSLGDQRLRLEAGRLRLVGLPPGIVARLDIDPEDGEVLGVQGQRLTLELSGGLGGLLLDTRDVPLRLPDASEQRRALLDEWEGPAWADSER